MGWGGRSEGEAAGCCHTREHAGLQNAGAVQGEERRGCLQPQGMQGGGRTAWVPAAPQLPWGMLWDGASVLLLPRRGFGRAAPDLPSNRQLLPPLCCLRRGLSLQE